MCYVAMNVEKLSSDCSYIYFMTCNVDIRSALLLNFVLNSWSSVCNDSQKKNLQNINWMNDNPLSQWVFEKHFQGLPEKSQPNGAVLETVDFLIMVYNVDNGVCIVKISITKVFLILWTFNKCNERWWDEIPRHK